MANTSKNLTIASLVIGAIGFSMFLYCKFMFSKAEGQKCPVNMASKLVIALGLFLLAGAVYELANKQEKFCAGYCNTAHDPDNPMSYNLFCGPPPS